MTKDERRRLSGHSTFVFLLSSEWSCSSLQTKAGHRQPPGRWRGPMMTTWPPIRHLSLHLPENSPARAVAARDCCRSTPTWLSARPAAPISKWPTCCVRTVAGSMRPIGPCASRAMPGSGVRARTVAPVTGLALRPAHGVRGMSTPSSTCSTATSMFTFDRRRAPTNSCMASNSTARQPGARWTRCRRSRIDVSRRSRPTNGEPSARTGASWLVVC